MSGPRHRARDDGSVLLLVPAGFLIVLLLGAIAVDLSVVLLRQRQASSLAIDIANDLATAALDADHLRETGRFRLDPARAGEIARSFVVTADLAADVVRIETTVDAGVRVTVTLTVQVDYLFARSIPGADDGTTVQASATAVALAR